MYIEEMNAEAEAQNGEDENPQQTARETAAEQSRRFAETGETSMTHEPVAEDFSSMDAIFGNRKRVARPT